MADRLDLPGWLSERSAITVLALVSVVLGLLVVLPYLQYVLLAVVLAYVLMPAQRRLEDVVGSMTAALTLVAVAVLAILLPLGYVLAIALREALEVVTAFQEGNLDVQAVESQLESTGLRVDLVDVYQTYQEPIATGVQGLATTAMEFVSGLPRILIGLTVTLFVLFSLLRDGDRLIAWSYRISPIEDHVQQELYRKLDQLMWASVVGNVAVAGIQAVLLGIGLAVLEVPAVVFLTVATFVLALLPLVGAFGVWVPVSVYLLAIDQPLAAAALVVYGSLVSASDTYLRPALIGRSSAFNSAIVVLGIFGGIVVFGAVGLFIGPVVLGGAKITLDVFARERARTLGEKWGDVDETGADPAVDTDSETGIGSGVDGEDGKVSETATNAESTTDESDTEPELEEDNENGADEVDSDPTRESSADVSTGRPTSEHDPADG
ncbi:AI-2E family transporter [Natrarchaeobaculum sulfurireducens]|uniref:PurR-regulated permease PerM n=1 Tax=Natrarchaeobaculum sulfurireducens TaxID=2044521 RepID=A0A346PDL3_9EURY|nr:AI-2E family transporter [Natrarchaeobaculum sulfurireducens]AXR77608.1 PurR-regulated permease PerM [Natrarchaeobaculum sulfurireducens]